MKNKIEILIVAIIIATAVVLVFGSASIGMWDEKVHMVTSPDGEVVCAYVKAVGMSGHKKFLDESEVMEYDNHKVVVFQSSDSVRKIIELAGRKAWVKEKDNFFKDFQTVE